MTVRSVLLHPHPATPCPPGLSLAVDVAFDAAGDLELVYRLCGPLATLAIPAAAPSQATDGLWQHTCCEAFVAAVDAPLYHEFNFSPSTAWAAYRFPAWRERDPGWSPAAVPQVVPRHSPDCLTLTACLPAVLLPPGPCLCLGLSAVVETSAGEISYWALHHPGERPDFHRRDGFLLELQRP